jgi:hypothetical protein
MRPLLLAALLVPVAACGIALGNSEKARRELAVGIGYGHLVWDGHNTNELEEQGGLRLDIRYSIPVAPQPEWRVGAGLGLAFYISEHGGDVFEEGGIIFIRPDDWVQLTNVEPEIQFSLRHPLGDGFYLEPGVAGVFIAGNYRRGEEVFGFVDEDLNRWRVGGGARLFLRAACTRGRSSYGVEGSYSYGWLDFGDDLGGDIQQACLAFFYAYRL